MGDSYELACIPGDGIGPEVVAEARRAVGAAAARFGFTVDWVDLDLGADRWLRTGEALPDTALKELGQVDAILLGAVGRPDVPPGVLERGLLLRLRFELDLYVNLRPVKLYPGVASPLAGVGPDDLDLLVVRENTEGVYAGAGGTVHRGTPMEVATETSIETRAGVERCLRYAAARARERAHLLLGLVVAVTNLDEVVKLIRGSASPAQAREKLLEREWPGDQIRPYIALVEAVEPKKAGKSYKLSEAQVKAILELRLHRLTALGRDEIGNELKELAESIGELLEILANRVRLYEVMREEFDEVEREFATPRVSELAPAAEGIEDEDLIEREDMVVTVTMTGYIKRTPLAVFREQKRGGKGRAGMQTKEEDAVTNLFVTSTHNPVLFFSNLGRVYRMKVWRLPEGGPTATVTLAPIPTDTAAPVVTASTITPDPIFCCRPRSKLLLPLLFSTGP